MGGAALHRPALGPAHPGGARERADLARWIKGALPPLHGATEGHRESGWLAQFAGAALGDTGLVLHGLAIRPDPMPAWLGAALPTGAGLSLGVRLGRDGDRLILECVEPEPRWPRLDLPTPAPAPVHIACEHQANLSPGWAPLFPGCRIPLSRGCRALILQTLDGRRFRLTAAAPDEATPPGLSPPNPVVLVHAPGDEAPARRLAALLERQSIRVRVEQQAPVVEGVPAGVADPEERIMRLWSERAAQALAADPRRRRESFSPAPPDYRLLVMLDKTPWPEGLESSGPEPARVDLSDARGEWGPEEARKLLAALSAGLGDEPPGSRPEGSEQPRRPDGGTPAIKAKSPPKAATERLLAELDNPKNPPRRRLEIGDRLAELGDPRPGVGLDEKGIPAIDWVEIPAGSFRYGEHQETQELPAFFIARYPITNAQYQAFIAANGYQDARWWQDLIRPEKPVPSRWPASNRPRTNVSWDEAVAFCRWLSVQRGHEARLPTEWEWEKAARGTDGREYPWGTGYRSGLANVDETWHEEEPHDLQQTTAVGLYPQGASPYGVLDMAGNVWEWCLNEYHTPEHVHAGRKTRVVRGGSWYYDPAYARSAYRRNFTPGLRYDDIGFRVLCSSPIEPLHAAPLNTGPLKD